MHAVRIGARSLQAILLVIVAVSGAPFLSASVATAASVQDDEVDAGDSAEGTEGAEAISGVVAQSSTLRVRIVAGACDTPDANTPKFELSGAAPVGVSAAGEAYTSESEASVSLSDLLALPHVIAIDLDDAEFSVPIACAAIAGNVVGGKLVIGLLAVDSGELTGIAVLGETNGGTATLVQAYVILTSDTGGEVDGEDRDIEEDTVDGEGGV